MSESAVSALRQFIAIQSLDGVIVPRADEWQGEYVAPYADRLKYLTGFSGSYGIAAVLTDTAALFVDGRYTVQAKQQVNPADFDVIEVPQNRLSKWLTEQLPDGGKIGYDPWLFTFDWVEGIEKTLGPKNITLIPLSENPVDACWDKKPAFGFSPVMVQPIQFSGKSTFDKLQTVAQNLKERSLDYFFINEPDSIAWLFNVRAHDVPHTPYVLARALVKSDGTAQLFIHPSRVDDGVRQSWNGRVTVNHPDELPHLLHSIGNRGQSLAVDKDSCPTALYRLMADSHVTPVFTDDPCIADKARKNQAEIDGMRKAHINDAVALTKFFYWLENRAVPQKMNEYEIGVKLHEFRAENPDCTDDSFDAIVGFNENGAIVHYRAENETAKTVDKHGLLLIDSGGQYPYGTTDITRTVATGAVSKEIKDRYTRVLKGHIALASVRFPQGTTGKQLDVLARHSLWATGLDYSHGTGHGVGAYLSVHEGPHSVSPRGKDVPLEIGMVLSNEPGYYKENAYGIRFENLMLVADDTVDTDEQPMRKFETLSLFPVDMSLLDKSLLNDTEIAWINRYHARIRTTVMPLIDKTLADWLRSKTKPLKKCFLSKFCS